MNTLEELNLQQSEYLLAQQQLLDQIEELSAIGEVGTRQYHKTQRKWIEIMKLAAKNTQKIIHLLNDQLLQTKIL